jgi:kinesin family protein 2/24
VEREEWDCVDMQAKKWVICHDGRLERTGRRLNMLHRAFAVDKYMSENSGDAELKNVVQPYFDDAWAGRSATVLLIGQTGTGKTHTLMGILRLLLAQSRDVDIQFFEVNGKNCYDLLNDRKLVHLRADENDQVHVRGAETVTFAAENNGALEERLTAGLALRSAKATERNPMSSRSHAVLSVSTGGGTLRLVDLAGSERNYETSKMSAKEHREFAENSASLMALRACFRSLHQKGRKPYRSAKLTHLLKDSFSAGHRTCVLATASPSASDVIHTQHTLEVATALVKKLEDQCTELSIEMPVAYPPVNVPVEQWTTEELDAWLGTAEDGRFSKLALPPGMDGAGIFQLRDLGSAFDRDMRDARGDDEGVSWNIGAQINQNLLKSVFEALTAENEARAKRDKSAPLIGGQLLGR